MEVTGGKFGKGLKYKGQASNALPEHLFWKVHNIFVHKGVHRILSQVFAPEVESRNHGITTLMTAPLPQKSVNLWHAATKQRQESAHCSTFLSKSIAP